MFRLFRAVEGQQQLATLSKLEWLPYIGRFLGDLEDPSLPCCLRLCKSSNLANLWQGFNLLSCSVAYGLAVLRPAIHLKIPNLVIFISYKKSQNHNYQNLIIISVRIKGKARLGGVRWVGAPLKPGRNCQCCLKQGLALLYTGSLFSLSSHHNTIPS